MKIAVVQSRSTPRAVEENTRAGLEWCRKARENGADLILFPECFLTGYQLPISNDQALSPDSEPFLAFRRWAQENRTGVLITSFCKGKRAPRNTALLLGRDGELLLRYDKVHTCDFSLEACLESGEEFRVCKFDGVSIGVMICYDREYPESARVLMLKGAELILVPNDCGSMQPRVAALSTRAYENMTGVVMANPPGEGAGRSCAFSPICWDGEGTPVDNTLLMAGEQEEGLFYAEFDLSALRRYREHEMMGNTFRKTAAYGPLLDPEVRDPFHRVRGGSGDFPPEDVDGENRSN